MEDSNKKGNMGTVLGVIAIVLAGAALVLAFMAYNQSTEESLEPVVTDQVEQTIQEMLQPQPAPGGQEETPEQGQE